MLVQDLKIGDYVRYKASHPSDKAKRSYQYASTVHSVQLLPATVLLVTSTHPQGIALAYDTGCELETATATDNHPVQPKEAPGRSKRGRCID